VTERLGPVRVRVSYGPGANNDRVFLSDGQTWSEVIENGEVRCTFCDEVVDDRRFAVGLEIRRSFSRGSTEYRFSHVECLRAAMHPRHKLH